MNAFPAVMLTGPRQAGKTTTLKRLFGGRFRYVSLDDPVERDFAVSNPLGFLGSHPDPVILDEAQYAPSLLTYLKLAIDEDRSRRGRFVLTGSQNLLLSEKVTESLAARVAVLRLLPLAHREIEGRPHARLPWEVGSRAGSGSGGAATWPHRDTWSTRGNRVGLSPRA